MLIIECDKCGEEFEKHNLICPHCESMRLQIMDLVKDLSEERGISVNVR